MKKHLLIYPVLVAMLAGCGAAKPLFTNSHEDVFVYNPTIPSLPVDVTVDPRPLTPVKETPPPEKTFADWPDSLKHIYLKAMAARTRTPQELVSALQLPLAAPEKKAEKPRPMKFDEYKIVFEFANVKHYSNLSFAHPGTRLEVLNTTLDIDPSSYAYFYSIDKMQNEFEELNMGSLERTQNVSFNVKGNLTGTLGGGTGTKSTNGNTDTNNSGQNQSAATFDANGNQTSGNGATGGNQSTHQGSSETTASADAKITAGVEAAYANEQAVKEAVSLKFQQMMLGFALTPRQLTVSQHSRPNSDISKNVFVTANLKFRNSKANPNLILNADVAYFSGIYDANNQPAAASALSLNQRLITYVDRDSAQDVSFTVGFEGKLRAVGNEKGESGNNWLEYDDHVTYYPFKNTATKTFVLDRNEYAKTVYQVKATLNYKTAYLYIAAPVRRMLDLFGDESPELFLQWLNDQLENPAAAKLQAKKFSLYFEDDQQHRVYVVAPAMNAARISALSLLSNLELEAIHPPTPRRLVGGR